MGGEEDEARRPARIQRRLLAHRERGEDEARRQARIQRRLQAHRAQGEEEVDDRRRVRIPRRHLHHPYHSQSEVRTLLIVILVY
jgi:hypothetical protein